MCFPIRYGLPVEENHIMCDEVFATAVSKQEKIETGD